MDRTRARSATGLLTSVIGLLLVAGAALDLLEHPVVPPATGTRWMSAPPAPQPVGAWGAGHAPTQTPTPPPEREASSVPGPAGPSSSSTDAATTPAPAPAPVHLTIDRLSVRTPVVPVGVLPDGGMEVPADVGTVGWYATAWRRISPGDAGVAVLAGHRDSRTAGPGALHQLAQLDVGDRLSVLHADGTTSLWEVSETTTIPRDALPRARLFATSGPPELAVITCGGPFDLITRSYTHNVIIYASLAAGQTQSADDEGGGAGSRR
jgi:sortase (surface protein transpeptidase)